MAARMKLGPHIRKSRKTGIYEYRRSVPERIRQLVSDIDGFGNRAGRKELTKSLGTKNLRDANVNASVIDANVQRAFDEAERRLNPTKSATAVTQSVTPADVSRVLLNWQKDIVSERKSQILNGHNSESPFFEGLNNVFDGAYNLGQMADYPATEVNRYTKIPDFDDLLVSVLKSGNLIVDVGSPAVPQIRPLFAKAWFSAYSEIERLSISPLSIWIGEAVDLVETEIPKSNGTQSAANGTIPAQSQSKTEDKSKKTKFDQYVDDWKSDRSLSSSMRPRQVDMYSKHIRNFSKFSGGQYLETVTRKNIRDWAIAMLQKGETPIKVTTARARISGIKNYWKFLQAREIVDERDIFSRLDLPNTTTKRSAERQAWKPDDIPKLWHAARAGNDHVLADMIRIAAFTGGRIESLTNIKKYHIKNVDGVRSIYIPKDKNYSGERTIPIHPSLEKQIDRLIASSDKDSGYLFNLGGNNQYSERSPALSKRFGRLKKRMGFGPELVFHSIRKTAATMFARLGINEKIAADVLGHSVPTMTYGLYAAKSDASDKLRAMVLALNYPDQDFMGAE